MFVHGTRLHRAEITPQLRSGHVVTQPVGVEGAEPGDAIVIRIERLDVISKATENRGASAGSFVSSASVGKKYVPPVVD